MSVKLLTENDLQFLSLKGGCSDLSESTLVKIPHCWKSHVTAQLCHKCPEKGELCIVSKLLILSCSNDHKFSVVRPLFMLYTNFFDYFIM